MTDFQDVGGQVVAVLQKPRFRFCAGVAGEQHPKAAVFEPKDE